METPSHPDFSPEQTFSGFNAEYIVHIHELIFDMVWWSEGRFDWETLYNMPIYLRNFYLKKLNQKLEERKPN